MLHFQAVDPVILGLLKKIQKNPSFSGLRLVGGTSLALQIGHRKSVDIDLFGAIEADDLELAGELRQIGKTEVIRQTKNIKTFLIDGIKTDFVIYHYPWLSPPIEENGITLAGKTDIAAMKLSAITGRGSKKDFIDLFFLLREFSLGQMMEFFSEKYADGSPFLVLKSLAYFADADKDPMPVMLEPHSWAAVKKDITRNLSHYVKSL
jgi:hypothetical protein